VHDLSRLSFVNVTVPAKVPNMAKTLKGVSELEAILLVELRKTPHCEGASSVSVYRLAEGRVDTNWTVAGFNAGTSGRANCEAALDEIERRLHRLYALDPLRK
jgi:hypothetical protein